MSHYAFEYKSGLTTTMGELYAMSGRHSIAGQLVEFQTKLSRNCWVAGGFQVEKHRAKLTKQQAGEHLAGYPKYLRLEQAIQGPEVTR